MSVALVSTSTGTISGTTPLTISHTVASGSDRYIEVSACCTNSSDFLAGATVTYGGVSMGSPIVTAVAGSSNRFTYVWGMVAPAVGTANVVVTPSAGAYLDGIVRSYTGVDQSTPVAGSTKFANSISSPLSAQALTCPAGGLLADFFTARATGQTLTPGSSQTQSGSTIAGGVSTSAGSTKASNDLSWSAWTGSQACAHVGIALNPSVSATLSGNVDLGSVAPGGGFGSSASDIGGNVDLGGVAPGGGFGVTPGTINLSLRNTNNGTWPLTAVPWLTFDRLTDAVQVLSLNNRVTDAASALSINNAALVPGQWYAVTAWHTDGTKIGAWVKQAV